MDRVASTSYSGDNGSANGNSSPNITNYSSLSDLPSPTRTYHPRKRNQRPNGGGSSSKNQALNRTLSISPHQSTLANGPTSLPSSPTLRNGQPSVPYVNTPASPLDSTPHSRKLSNSSWGRRSISGDWSGLGRSASREEEGRGYGATGSGSGSAGGGAGKGDGEALVGKSGGGVEEAGEPSTKKFVLLTLSLAGAQLIWTVEQAYGTPYLLSLGLSKELTSLVWLAGPLSGLIAQPVIGALSDSSRSRYRRRGYIIGSSLFLLLSTIGVAFAKPLASLWISIWGSGIGDWDPLKSSLIQSAAIKIAVISFYVLDFSLNALQASCRSLILDSVPAHYQEQANAWHGRMTHIGNIVGFSIGYTDLAGWKGLRWIGGDDGEGGQFRKLCVVALIIGIGCLAVTCFTQDEKVLGVGVGAGDEGPRGAWNRSKKAFRNVWRQIRYLPLPIRRVCYVQFFAWLGWFPFLFYATTWVSEILCASEPSTKPSVAQRAGSLALLIYAFIAMFAGSFLPSLSSLGRSEFILSRRGKHWDRLRRAMSWITPRNLWTISNIWFFVLMGVASFWVRDLGQVMVVVGLMGISWAVTCWVPYALVMEFIREIEDDPFTAMSRRTLSNSALAMDPESPNPDHAHQTSKVERNEANVAEAFNECRPLLSGAPAEVREVSVGDGGKVVIDGEDEIGGTILGIHNLAIVAPQFIVALIASLIFKIIDSIDSSPSSSLPPAFSDSPTACSNPGRADVVWVLRFGGLMAIGAAIASRFVPVTPTEEEYVEMLRHGEWSNESGRDEERVEDD